MCKMVVIISKGNGGFRSIGIVDILHKALSEVVNWWIGAVVKFHDVLQGLRSGQRTGNAPLEAKLLQQLMAMREEVLYEVLIKIWKFYDDLYIERCMDILVGFGIGPRTERVL